MNRLRALTQESIRAAWRDFRPILEEALPPHRDTLPEVGDIALLSFQAFGVFKWLLDHHGTMDRAVEERALDLAAALSRYFDLYQPGWRTALDDWTRHRLAILRASR